MSHETLCVSCMNRRHSMHVAFVLPTSIRPSLRPCIVLKRPRQLQSFVTHNNFSSRRVSSINATLSEQQQKRNEAQLNDAIIQLGMTAIAALFSIQARRDLLAVLITFCCTPTLFSAFFQKQQLEQQRLLFKSSKDEMSPSYLLSTLHAQLDEISSTLQHRDEHFEQSLANLQATLDNPVPLSLSSQQQQKEVIFSEIAELRALRLRASRLDTINGELHARLLGMEAKLLDMEHHVRVTDGELRGYRAIERALRERIATLEVNLQRMESLEMELEHERKQVDHLYRQLYIRKRTEESLRLSTRDSDSRVSRLESILKSLGIVNIINNSNDDDEIDQIEDNENENDREFWNRELQKKVDRLVPESIIGEEFKKQANRARQFNINRNSNSNSSNTKSSSNIGDMMTTATDWPKAPLQGGNDNNDDVSTALIKNSSESGNLKSSTPSKRVDGLPPDGGFAGGDVINDGIVNVDRNEKEKNDDETKDNSQSSTMLISQAGAKAGSGEGAFAFSRGEFDETSMTKVVSNEKEEEEKNNNAEENEEKDETLDGLISNDDNISSATTTLTDEKKENDIKAGKDTEKTVITETNDKTPGSSQTMSYLQTLGNQSNANTTIVSSTDEKEQVDDKESNEQSTKSETQSMTTVDEISSQSVRKEVIENNSTNDDCSAEEKEETISNDVDISTARNEIFDSQANNNSSIAVTDEEENDVQITSGSIETTSNDEEESGTNDTEEDLKKLTDEAKEFVNLGRQRGLSVHEASVHFENAVSRYEKVLNILSSSLSLSTSDEEKSIIETDLGVALVAWGKIDITNKESQGRLSRAAELLLRHSPNNNNEENGNSKRTTILFSAGLCHSLLAATTTTGENTDDEAKKLYLKACELFEELIDIDPNSRIACFNCGLSYISLARIVKARNEQEEEEKEEEKEELKEWLTKGKRMFERALQLKPGDAKAGAYAEECSRLLESI